MYSDVADAEEDVTSLPGVKRYGIDRVVPAIQPIVNNSLQAVLLFGVPSSSPKVNCTILLQ